MPSNKNKQLARGISWKTIGGILLSIATLVGALVNGLDFINYVRVGNQDFLWLALIVFGIIWLVILWLLFKQRNVYGILWFAVTIIAGVVIWNGWSTYIQTRETKLVVLITKFDGPEEAFGLLNQIIETLNADFPTEGDVEIETIDEIITPEKGSARARELGEKIQADIVI